jgi:hypothetical protein
MKYLGVRIMKLRMSVKAGMPGQDQRFRQGYVA